MCTLGGINGKLLFKNRDLWPESDLAEEIVHGRGRYRYVGVRGHAAPQERGLNSGINEAGVAVAITYADHISLDRALAARTPRGVLVEEILAASRDLESALQTVADYFSVPLPGGNIVIMTPAGGAVVEQIPPRFAVEIITEPVVVRSNHFLNLQVTAPLVTPDDDSRVRWRRMAGLLAGESAVDVATAQKILADHDGLFPICRHAGELVTVSSAIYDLTSITLHYAYGPPCVTEWNEFRP